MCILHNQPWEIKPVGEPFVFGFVVGVSVVFIFCVIPCERYNFLGVLNFNFKLEPFIDHIKVSDAFETGDLDLDLQDLQNFSLIFS